MAEKLDTVEIKKLQIFKVGVWNGDKYTLKDLESMVEAFDKVGFQPTIKAGHEGKQENEKEAKRVFGTPALGYVSKVYIDDDTLYAELVDVPKRFAKLIDAGAYKRVSAEIYWNYKSGDEVFSRVLKSVAFLGAEIPALTDLEAIESLYQVAPDTGAVFAYDDNGNEFRVYDYYPDSACGASFADFILSQPRKTKQVANYTDASDENRCRVCRFYQWSYGGVCSLVEGSIRPDDVCDFFELATETFATKESINSKEESMAEKQTLDGKQADSKDQIVDDVKNHSQEDKSMAAEDRVKLVEEVRQELIKEFEAKQQVVNAEKETAEQEKKALADRVAKLESEKRAERIDRWVEDQKRAGKIAPVEEQKIRALRGYLKDEGDTIKYFAKGENGTPAEVADSPAKLFAAIIENRPSLFQDLSAHSEESQDSPLDDPGDEAHRLTTEYQKKTGEKDYRTAMQEVFKVNKELEAAWLRSKN